MHKHFLKFLSLVMVVSISISLSGCTLIFQKGRRSDVEKISQLKSQLTDLERAKQELESRLSSEIDDNEVQIDMLDKGLVITFVSEVLFASGKADLRADSLSKLEKVASVLKTTVSDLNVGIEGHTDNVPITHSGWKSNWELSTARALSVLHHLEDNEGISPKRLSATGYGEFRPVASNATKAGKQDNRRVEIVILPKTMPGR
ncbi:MAG: OmpA family protein [Candidatus Omnitrophica bacterium]|nr:OmpA family protein [Candidatus Omnitrophota bacterium]MCK5179462.1 OmpA family protein [Candidatus Omnitrophota bacterium]